jgi:hypothetical protein
VFATGLTTIHTLLCFGAIAAGIPAIRALFGHATGGSWAWIFLILAGAATATGFLFPFLGATPAFVTGIVSTVILVLVFAARLVFGGAGVWRRVDALGQTASLYLLVFVLIAQLFQKVPALNASAPTGSELPFAIAQATCLAAFVWIGWRLWRRTSPGVAA